MKRVCTTLASLAVGGLLGYEFKARWKDKPVHATGPIYSNRPSEIMKYGFPGSANVKVQ